MPRTNVLANAMAIIAIASSLAKKAGDLVVGTNKACFNKESRENKCSYGISVIVGRICAQI